MSARGCRRVLMTGDAVGGVWTYALELARALAARGVDTVLATMGAAPSDAQRAEAARVPRLELRWSTLKLEWMDDPWDDLARSRDWLARIADEVQPDLLHANTYAHGDLEVDLPRVVVGHSCVLSWWRAVKGEDAPPALGRYRALVRGGLAGADAVAAPTAAMLDALVRHYGPLPRARVVANGRDAALFRPAEKHAVVLGAGRFWDEAKNIACLDRAAARLPWPIRLAGERADPDGRGPRAEHAIVLGRLEPSALARELAGAAVFAAPARYEPFGLGVLEAALSGCALVLGDIASLRETWDGAALFAPSDDDAAVAAAIRRLMADDGLRVRLGGRARARALELSPERMADATLALYADAVDARAARRRDEEAACAS